jgi:hypothetical protein
MALIALRSSSRRSIRVSCVFKLEKTRRTEQSAMESVSRICDGDLPEFEEKREARVVPLRAKLPLVCDPKLFQMVESLLTCVQRQLLLMAKSSAFAGKEDIERCAKVALLLSARIQAELQGAVGNFSKPLT